MTASKAKRLNNVDPSEVFVKGITDDDKINTTLMSAPEAKKLKKNLSSL